MTNWQNVAQKVQSGLPKPLNRRRCRLLPKILHEWSRTDLPEHLSWPSRASIRARIKKLKAVKRSALQLMHAINDVDERGRADIALLIAIAERGGSYTPGAVSQREFWSRIDRLNQEPEFLVKLAAIAPDQYYLRFGKRRPRNIPAYLVLRDMAEIYEWLTGRPATREVGRSSGSDTGPFFRFASTLWPVVFERGTAGLSYAMKNWAKGKNLFGERSPVIVNIAMHHPSWRVFDH